MNIRILVTGGTLDCDHVDEEGIYQFKGSCVPDMLAQGQCHASVEVEILFLKDSIYTTDTDRQAIVHACQTCPEDHIVITHGTDTMTETAQLLEQTIFNKTIVLLGAMIPFKSEKSDALFNLGSALAAVQCLKAGVYITMHGQIFHANNVRKNKDKKRFEPLNIDS